MAGLARWGPLIVASAPAKVILFGEHAVVFGEPAIAAAVDLRVHVGWAPSQGGASTVNGYPLTDQHHAFMVNALRLAGVEGDVTMTSASDVPSASGLGSSAALTVASVAAGLASRSVIQHPLDAAARETIGPLAYEAEWLAQGGSGSPTDTTTCTLGGGVLVDSVAGAGHVRAVTRGERTWHLHGLDIPSDWSLVIGNTGERGRTADQVARVGRLVRRRAFARETVGDIGALVRQARKAVQAADAGKVGALMDRNHNLLAILGVSTKRLDRYVEVARRSALGAKLTGSGGGGCMIALTRDPARTAADLARVGAVTHVVRLGAEGVRMEPDSAMAASDVDDRLL